MVDRKTSFSSFQAEQAAQSEAELQELRALTKSHLETIVGLRPKGTNIGDTVTSSTLGKRFQSGRDGSWLIGPLAKVLEIDDSKTVSVHLGFPTSGGRIPEYVEVFKDIYNGRKARITMWGDQGRVDDISVNIDHVSFSPRYFRDKPEHSRQELANEVLGLVSQDLQEARSNWKDLLQQAAQNALNDLDERYEKNSPRRQIVHLIDTVQSYYPKDDFVVLFDPEHSKKQDGVNILLLTDLEISESLARKINKFGHSHVEYQRSVPRGTASITQRYSDTEIRIQQTALGWWNQFDMSEASFNSFYYGEPESTFFIHHDDKLVLLHYNTVKPSDRDPSLAEVVGSKVVQ